MNCVECQENMVAGAEGLLDPEQLIEHQTHLERCADCRTEYESVSGLHQRLVAHGQSAADVSLVAPVMRRIHPERETEGNTIMNKLFTRWGFGLSAAAGVAAVVIMAVLISPRTQATAAEVMARGAKAVARLSSIHLRGQLRTLPNDNFSYIDAKHEFCGIELWKQFEPELKWRVDKPGRVATMDGQSTLLFIKPANLAMKVPRPSSSAFDTEWLHQIANLSATIEKELENATAKNWPLALREERGADGRAKAVVTIQARAGLADSDYLKNKFFDTADTRRVYYFDAETELLEAVQVFLKDPAGEVLIFDLQQIVYDQPIDPGVFQLELPANVNWHRTEMEKLPDNEKYASMTAEEAARAYFEALSRQDWTEAEKFRRDLVSDPVRQRAAGLEIISLGQAFGSEAYDPSGRFVPYEIQVNGQRIKHNLALKKDARTGRWYVDGGGF